MHGDTKKRGCHQVSPGVSVSVSHTNKPKFTWIHRLSTDSHKYASLPGSAAADVQTPTVAGFDGFWYVTADIEILHAF